MRFKFAAILACVATAAIAKPALKLEPCTAEACATVTCITVERNKTWEVNICGAPLEERDKDGNILFQAPALACPDTVSGVNLVLKTYTFVWDRVAFAANRAAAAVQYLPLAATTKTVRMCGSSYPLRREDGAVQGIDMDLPGRVQ